MAIISKEMEDFAITYRNPLTIGELIDILSGYPRERVVYVQSSGGEYNPQEIYTIRVNKDSITLDSSILL